VVALAFGLPVGTDLTAGTEPAVIHAQIAGCDLVTTGCRLEIGQARQAVLNDATSPHVWLLHVDADEDVLVGTTCSADVPYRLYAYGPNRSLVDVVNPDPGENACVALILSDPTPGEYQVIVDSPTGVTSPDPYRIYAVLEESHPGTVVLNDSLGDWQRGSLVMATEPGLWAHDYREGEYAIEVADPDSYGRSAWLPFTDPSATLAIDVRVLADSPNWSATLSCRESSQGYYRLIVDTWRGPSWSIDLCQGGDCQDLADWTTSSAIRSGPASNHVELTCLGSRLSVRINGTDVGGVTDDTLRDGSFGIGTLRLDDASLRGEVRFRNLTLTDR